MTAAPRIHFTYAEYLAFERSSDVKHDFVRGLILAMAGGKPEHGARAVRVMSALTAQLGRRPCVVYDSDVRVRVREVDQAFYPDASVVCGQLETDRDDPDAIVNPVVLLEVLSPSTEEYDRGEKLDAYKLLASVREVVFVAHDAERIEVCRRQSDAWTAEVYCAGQSVPLDSIGCALDVSEVFRNPFGSI
jgi:Uma2 family endonuclease